MNDTIPYIPRQIAEAVSEAARYFSVITVTGPRQSGKSTLLRHLYPDVPYISLESPDIRLSAMNDPKSLLTSYGDRLIIDEVQRVPELLSYIQTVVDLEPHRRYYLTGSSQFSLLKNISQSLAGRSAVFELLPLSLPEISNLCTDKTADDILYSGFYPAVWSGKNKPSLLYPNYNKTYIERDVRTLLGVRDLDAFQRFIKLCAARIGSIFNASELSNEIGVSVNTVNSWLSVLQASYIVYLLPPFFTNTRKRLTKSPKIYFTDCGLAAYLLDIDSPQIMDRDKMRGHLFENMVVIEAYKNALNRGKTPQLYFYRDSNGNEVDLLTKHGSGYRCFEIKSSSTFHPSYAKGLESFAKAFPDLTIDKTVVYSGETLPDINGIAVKNYTDVKY